MTFVVILTGWIFSVCLHEFSHANVAYRGGDLSVKDKGYLSFNPVKYADPVYSLALPVLFLLMGGIGLPGAAVYIDRSQIRNKTWQSAVSLAGPFSNAVLAVIIGLLLQFTAISTGRVGPALSFLGLLQVSSVILSLLPIPPLDGYGAIEPFLPDSVTGAVHQYSRNGMLLMMLALWYIPAANASFWNSVYAVSSAIGIPPQQAIAGLDMFEFWNH